MKKSNKKYILYYWTIGFLVFLLIIFSIVGAIKIVKADNNNNTTLTNYVEEMIKEIKEQTNKAKAEQLFKEKRNKIDEEHQKIESQPLLKEIDEIYESLDNEFNEEEYEEYPETGYVEEYYEEPVEEINYTSSYSPEYLMNMGVVYDGGYRYTWYSERVLPGGGLNIPGRWSDGNFVRDEDGYICVASSDMSKGTVIETPWGTAKVYDSGCASGTIDMYVSW